MVTQKRIILPHGQLTKLASKAGVGERTCSMYLKGWYDESDNEVVKKALEVREMAKSDFGGVES